MPDNLIRSIHTLGIPPGATLRELLADREMTQKEFAVRVDLSEKHVSHLINGKVELTHDVALRMEAVLGIPASFWNNLEALYRETLARIDSENAMDEDLKALINLPYQEMAESHWVEKTKIRTERVLNMRRFFEVANLRLVNQLNWPIVSFRTLGHGTKSSMAILVWLQRIRQVARTIQTGEWNEALLKEKLPSIRSLTLDPPEVFHPKLMNELAACGVALVILPHLKGSYLHGATYMDHHRMVIGLIVRNKDAYRFWFSFFHEIGHLVLGHVKELSTGLANEDPEMERAADEYACNILIPEDQYRDFSQETNMSKDKVISFSEACGIAPGIVVGRLQNERLIGYDRLNELKESYVIITG